MRRQCDSENLDYIETVNSIAGKTDTGLGSITPAKKSGELLVGSNKKFNSTINSTRSAVERCVAHFKLWRIFETRYRRPLRPFKQTLHAIIAVEFLKRGFR
jgi:hypothetical protein